MEGRSGELDSYIFRETLGYLGLVVTILSIYASNPYNLASLDRVSLSRLLINQSVSSIVKY